MSASEEGQSAGQGSLPPDHQPKHSAGQGSLPTDDQPKKRVVKTLRACDNCRKQKMRCIGSDEPPCKRCRNANLECIFSRQPREAVAPSIGEDRIKKIEDQMETMGSTLKEMFNLMRGSTFPAPSAHIGPSGSFDSLVGELGSSSSTQLPGIDSLASMEAGPSNYRGSSTTSGADPPFLPTPHTLSDLINDPETIVRGPRLSDASFSNGGMSIGDWSASPVNVGPPVQFVSESVPPLPPTGSALSFQALPTTTYHAGPVQVADGAERGQKSRVAGSAGEREQEGSSEEEELDADDRHTPLDIQSSSLLAPLDSMHSLAEAAASVQEVVARDSGKTGGKRDAGRVGGGGGPSRATKKVRLEGGGNAPGLRGVLPGEQRRNDKAKESGFKSCIEEGIVTEEQARALYKTFWSGADKFVAVFDPTVDSFELHRDELHFCLNSICYVASFIEDGGKGTSERQKQLWALVKECAMETLFKKSSKVDAVQSLMLVAAWNDEGWLCGGHAVRLALDIGCHEAFAVLLRSGMGKGKSISQLEGERELVVKARTWFYLFNFEHQTAFGKGRPTIVSVDEGIERCREFLDHPLAILTDMKLVATTEIMTIRSKYFNQLRPQSKGDATIDYNLIKVIREAHAACEGWFTEWEELYTRQKTSEKTVFYIDSARITMHYSQCFHNCLALQGLRSPSDVAHITPAQKELALRAIKNAQTAVDICLNSPSYRASFTYAVHHTFVCAAFAASLLMRIARLLPAELDLKQTARDVELLARLLDTVPAGRYARSLRLTLRSARKQDVLPPPSAPPTRPGSPTATRPGTLKSTERQQSTRVQPPPGGQSAQGVENFMLPIIGGDGSVEMESPSVGFDWGLSDPRFLDSLGATLDSEGRQPLWLSMTDPGSAHLFTGGMEDFFLPREVDSQLSLFMQQPFSFSSTTTPSSSHHLVPNGPSGSGSVDQAQRAPSQDWWMTG